MTWARCQDVAPCCLAAECASNGARVKRHHSASRCGCARDCSAELRERLTARGRNSVGGVARCATAAGASGAPARGAERPSEIEVVVDRRFVVLDGQDAWPPRLLASAREILSMCHPPGPADLTTRQAGADPAFRWRT